MTWEGIFIDIFLEGSNKTVTLGNLYRLTKKTVRNCAKFMEEFPPAINKICDENKEMIPAGDFNINLLNMKDNDTVAFFDFITSIN